MYELCPEAPSDTPDVEALYDLCFAPGRTALSSYRLRDGVPAVRELCLNLRNEANVLIAAIRYWPVRVSGKPVLLLGPIAVHPTAQAEGLGGYLMRESLNRAREMGWARVMLVGDAPYYSRFGFLRLDGVEMPPPTNPDRVLGLELQPDAWVGVHGPVTRETEPEVLAGIAEMNGSTDECACEEVDPVQARHIGTKAKAPADDPTAPRKTARDPAAHR